MPSRRRAARLRQTTRDCSRGDTEEIAAASLRLDRRLNLRQRAARRCARRHLRSQRRARRSDCRSNADDMNGAHESISRRHRHGAKSRRRLAIRLQRTSYTEVCATRTSRDAYHTFAAGEPQLILVWSISQSGARLRQYRMSKLLIAELFSRALEKAEWPRACQDSRGWS